jgi:hypothetical protein
MSLLASPSLTSRPTRRPTGCPVCLAPPPSRFFDIDLYLAISVDRVLAATATATSGTGDFGIASGDGAQASALGGFGDVTEASGTDAVAAAGGAGGDTFDTAVDIGDNADGSPETPFVPGDYVLGAYARDGVGSSDTAIALGNNDFDVAGIGSMTVPPCSPVTAS